jgi:uncharacterized protein (TIGR02597 family)
MSKGHLMRRFIPLLAVVASGFIYSTSTFAQVTAASDPVGFTTTSLLGSSDTLISIPFTRPPAFTGAIQSVAGSTITVAGTPGWTAGSTFVYAAGSQPNHYYALLGGGGTSNPKEGRFYPVTNNGTNTLTVTTTAANDLTGVTANTQVTIIPYWTVATAFPPTDANISFTPTSSVPTYKTQIRIPDDSAATISYSIVYYFDAATSKWRIESVGDPDRGDDVLSPDSFFAVRNENGAPTLPLTALGSVLMKKFSAPLMTSASGPYENAVTMLRPIDVPLNATGLKPSPDSSFIANDQLLVFDNTQAAINKTPAATYFYNTAVGNSGGWRLTGDGANDHGSDIIAAGSAMIVRKAQTGGGATTFWTNAFPVKALTAGSVKVHGGSGPFTQPLSLSLRWDSIPGVEPRSAGQTPAGGGVDHQIVMTFPSNVSFTSAIPTSGAAVVGSSSGNNTSTVTVNLTGVTNAQKVAITLVGVNDGTNTNDVAVEFGALFGDVNGDGFVLSGDYTAVRQKSGAALDGTTFKFDLNSDGFILSGDYTAARQQSGAHL